MWGKKVLRAKGQICVYMCVCVFFCRFANKVYSTRLIGWNKCFYFLFGLVWLFAVSIWETFVWLSNDFLFFVKQLCVLRSFFVCCRSTYIKFNRITVGDVFVCYVCGEIKCETNHTQIWRYQTMSCQIHTTNRKYFMTSNAAYCECANVCVCVCRPVVWLLSTYFH